jgi:F0F1-type ATP synthase delta subunit
MKYSRTQLARAYVRLLDTHSTRELAQGFARMLTGRGARRDVTAFSEDVVRVWGDTHNTVVATVTSARKLSPRTQQRISLYIQQQERKSHASMTYAIDPSLLGGAIVHTPTHTYDFSVHGKLTHIL